MPGLREPSHWLILVIVLVVIFGASRLPVVAKSLGQSMKIFKREMTDLRSDDSDSSASTTTPAASTTTSDAAPAAPVAATPPPGSAEAPRSNSGGDAPATSGPGNGDGPAQS